MAVASKKALELAISELPKRTEYVKKLNLRIRDALSKYPRVQINSPINAVPHILNLSVEGVRGTAFQRALGERGVCVSVRSACSTGGAPSKAVMALYGDRRRALSSWRISLSHLTTDDEIDKLLAAFDECYNTLAPLKSIV
jgi:cysteine desulfurase